MTDWKQNYKIQDPSFFTCLKQDSTSAIRNDNLQVCLIKTSKKSNSQFQNEPQLYSVLKQLFEEKHENLVNVLDIHDDNDNITYVVMEQFNNNLEHYFKTREEGFKTQEIFSFMKQITKGYQQLIENGVLHRNLNPGNIYYIQNNQDISFKIGGYCYAKILDDRDQPIDENTILFSNYSYKAPEAGTSNYNHNADIFSLGLILFQMATKEKFNIQDIEKLKKVNLKNLYNLDKIDQELKELLCRMIVYDNEARLTWSALIKQLFYQTLSKEKQFEIVTRLENNELCYVKIVEKQRRDSQYTLENARLELENNRILKGKINQNIIKIYEILHEPGNACIYIIMEKCDGDLKHLMKQKQFKTDEVFDLILQINNGYQYLETNKIIHRDIKPENILYKNVNGQIQYKIADFGISRQTDQANSKCGTLLYCAPEIDGRRSYSNKCDIFSLGILIYYVVFQKYPFDANNESQKQFFSQLKESGSFDNLNQKVDIQFQVDKRILQILNKMIVYDAEKRISWGEELKNLISLFQLQENKNEQEKQVKTFPIQQKFGTCPLPKTDQPTHVFNKQTFTSSNHNKFQPLPNNFIKGQASQTPNFSKNQKVFFPTKFTAFTHSQQQETNLFNK